MSVVPISIQLNYARMALGKACAGVEPVFNYVISTKSLDRLASALA